MAPVQTQNAIRGLAMLALAMSLGLPITGNAQTYKISFTGTCSGTNGDGAVFKQQVNNKTLIRDWAGRAGATNFNNLRLVFHLNANGEGGDSIEVVNKKTGEYVVSVFPLMFPQSATQTTDKGVKEKRFALVYNIFDPGNVRGTYIVSQQMSFKNGNTNNFNLDGQILWYQSPGPDNTNWFRICNGKFNASGKPLVFQ
jgi:hypothetical protein